MRIKHKLNPGWRPTAPEPIGDRYQAELDTMSARAEKAWRSAEKYAERATKRSERHSADLALRDAAIRARDAAIARYDEWKRLEAQMRQTPVGGTKHSGKGSVHRVHNREAM